MTLGFVLIQIRVAESKSGDCEICILKVMALKWTFYAEIKWQCVILFKKSKQISVHVPQAYGITFSFRFNRFLEHSSLFIIGAWNFQGHLLGVYHYHPENKVM